MVGGGCGPRWGADQCRQCNDQFNLFHMTSEAQGWNPDDVNTDYIVKCFTGDPICQAFLSANSGGHASHCNNDKAIGGYQCCASEFYVSEALKGNRRNNHRAYSTHD